MTQLELKFDVSIQKIKLSSDEFVVSDSRNFLKASFVFSDEWEGLTKTAIFIFSDKVYNVLLQEDTCLVPYEVIKPMGFTVSIYGVKSLTEITTDNTFVSVSKSGYKIGEAPPDPTPTIYNQLINSFDEKISTATEQADNAEVRATQAEQSANISVLNANTAIAQATTAIAKANEANTSATNAESEANRAESEADRAANNLLNGVSTHNESIDAHQDIRSDIRDVEAIAKGRARSHTFETTADMNAWLAIPENAATLQMGDNLYIVELGVPDYWWDGTQAQQLGAEKPDFSDYYKKEETDALLPVTIDETQYNEKYNAGTLDAGVIYMVRSGV